MSEPKWNPSNPEWWKAQLELRPDPYQWLANEHDGTVAEARQQERDRIRERVERLRDGKWYQSGWAPTAAETEVWEALADVLAAIGDEPDAPYIIRRPDGSVDRAASIKAIKEGDSGP